MHAQGFVPKPPQAIDHRIFRIHLKKEKEKKKRKKKKVKLPRSFYHGVVTFLGTFF